MTCEPYICTEGKPQGEIRWYQEGCPSKQDYDLGYWQPYADFEREKLLELYCYPHDIKPSSGGLRLDVPQNRDGSIKRNRKAKEYDSNMLIGYHMSDYCNASESSRLLKRAEFLKAVCEKEGVEWLPKAKPRAEQCQACIESLRNGHICGTVAKPSDPKPVASEGKCGCRNDKGHCWADKVNNIDVCTCPCHKKPQECSHCKLGSTYYAAWRPQECPCPCHKKTEEKCRHVHPNGEWALFQRPDSIIGCAICPEEWVSAGGKPFTTRKVSEEKCCIGFKLDGVLFHECKDHKPYCAKDYPCKCDSYTKAEVDEMFRQLKEANLKILENHHDTHRGIESEEREWRKEVIEALYWLSNDQPSLQKCIKALRSRFL